jgi:serine/threonine-protein kinase RsbT
VKIKTIQEALDAVVVVGSDLLDTDISCIYASDLMSDVLAFGKPDSLLLTGLASRQAVISAHMAEFKGVVLLRGKKIKEDTQQFATDNHLALLSTNIDMYDACVRIETKMRDASMRSETTLDAPKTESILLNNHFTIEGSDFAKAGMVSTDIKSLLKKIGINPAIVRRVAISTYEGEMNVIMHAKRAYVGLTVTPQYIEVIIRDEGKGIPNVELAMQEGYSTATEDQRALGFGSGMGLPNIKKNADQLHIDSVVDKGTVLNMRFLIDQSP